MKISNKIITLLFLIFPLAVFSQKVDYKKIFEKYNVDGSITVYDLKQDKWTYSNKKDSKTGMLPASTFKILNSLIALETGVIKDEYELIPWVGLENVDTSYYGYRPDIYKDMDLVDAFSKSAVWVYIELAKKIGKEKYKHYLDLCHYGNMDLSEKGIDFWNFGPLEITPEEQIKFLRDLYEEKLPFSKRTMTIVKKIMTTEIGGDYSIHAKTGMAIKDQTIGWWVGYVERKNNVYFFATRIRTDKYTPKFAQDRKDLTKEVLKELGIL